MAEWRMCVDYIDLNKHCPKDPFRLPWIDQIVDSTTGSALLSFLDCYSGYHQIALKEEDQSKTSFITPFGAYCYKTISFGLKNASATYQRAIQTFSEQIGDNAEAYVDDVVVKTKKPRHVNWRLEADFWKSKKVKVEIEPKQVCFRGTIRTTTRIPSQ
jgi:hypothetical protein